MTTQVQRFEKSSQPRRRKDKPVPGKGQTESRRRVVKKSVRTRKLSKTQLRNRCDSLCSKIIRLRDRVCTRCGSAAHLQWSHHLSRRFLIIRYDFDNAVAHCRACHMFFTNDPDSHTLWIITRIGMDAYMQLHEKRLRGTEERFRPDYVAIHAELKAKLERMEAAA